MNYKCKQCYDTGNVPCQSSVPEQVDWEECDCGQEIIDNSEEKYADRCGY